jgi:Cephalosporin hydroxylase
MLRAIERLLRPAFILGFHRAYYASGGWRSHTFLGYPIMQCPLDLQLYQEIVFARRPPFILQTGVAGGGSLLYFAVLLDAIGADPTSIVVGIDISRSSRAKTLAHPRIRVVEGSSVERTVVSRVRRLLPERRGMVVLDSDHSQVHVEAELHMDRRRRRELISRCRRHQCQWPPGILRPRPRSARGGEPVSRRQLAVRQDNRLWQRGLFSHHQYGWLERINDGPAGTPAETGGSCS